MARESRCIICGERRNGLAVKEDYMIGSIRWVKRNITRNEKNYALVVCKGCYPKYKKAFDKYQRRLMVYLALGIIFAIALMIGSSNILLSLLFGAGIILFLFLLSQLSYMPALVMPAARKKDGS